MTDVVESAPNAWAPLRTPAFRMLFIAMVASNIGMWMQMVGAQWLLIDEPNATMLIAFIQTAMTLPFAVFAMPAGILSDNYNRRSILVVVQGVQLVLATVLAALVARGDLSPTLLLGLLFALGSCTAASLIPFQASVADLVPRQQVPMAAAMTGLSANIARAVGPALAGILISSLGLPVVFAANAIGVAIYFVSALRWRYTPAPRLTAREPFSAALRAGARFARHSPHIRRLLARTIAFTIPAQAIWALLPLVAKRQLGLSVGDYGVLVAAIGVGAVSAALVLPWLRARWRSNGTIGIGMLAYAIALAGMTQARSLAEAVPLLFVVGFGWISTLSTVTGSLQMYLPAWVRARALAINTITLFGGQAIGAAIWGYLADAFALTTTYWIAAAAIGCASTLTVIRPLDDVENLDRTPARYWPEPEFSIDPFESRGAALVSIEYDIPEERVEEFLDAVATVRIVRLRTGASRWDLYRDVERPSRFVESYVVGSWEEHMRQHDGRLTESDRAHEQRANACSVTPPVVQHFVEAAVPRR